jgi:hypothetical protein
MITELEKFFVNFTVRLNKYRVVSPRVDIWLKDLQKWDFWGWWSGSSGRMPA